MATIETAWGVIVPVPEGTRGLNRFAAAANRLARDAFVAGDEFDRGAIEVLPADEWAWFKFVPDGRVRPTPAYFWLGAEADLKTFQKIS